MRHGFWRVIQRFFWGVSGILRTALVSTLVSTALVSAIPVFVAQVSAAPEPGATGATLTIQVAGLRSDQGVIHISVYDNASSYDDETGDVYDGDISLEAARDGFTLDNLAGGDYAVTLFHDENHNGDIDMNFLGIPVEGYGFSNNIKPLFSKPDFDDVKVRVAQGRDVAITIKLRY